jgi:endo-1,4-beta-xylanase
LNKYLRVKITMKLNSFLLSALVGLGLLASACSPSESTQMDEGTLKGAYRDAFVIGAALNPRQFTGQDAQGAALVAEQFSSISPENVLKWQSVHPEPGTYNFGPADEYVAFGEAHDMTIIGHTLVWHSQTPRWVFQNEDGSPVSRDTLIARMRDHIHTVVGRYRGRIAGWDVVNEALNEDGTLRDSPWKRIIGDDYLEMAYRFAREADPDAGLYYNDYSLPNPAKRDGAVRLVRSLQEQGAPITGIGLQGHYHLTSPTVEEIDDAIQAFLPLGIDIMFTDLDIDVLPSRQRGQSADISNRAEMEEGLNPYVDGLPDAVQTELANRYADLFSLFYNYRDNIIRVTFWGVTDGDSWKNGFPIRGRTNYPLLFDRSYAPKPAFDAVIAVPKESE